MKFFTHTIFAMAIVATSAGAGGHANWTSVADHSSIAFGSVKSDVIGEVHHFNSVSGTVSEAGEVVIDIDLSSIETNIDIRNERMLEHVFQSGKATAVLNGQVDMKAIDNLDIGSTMLTEMEGTLAFAGLAADIEAEMLIARLAEDRVLVTTADFIMLSTADLGIDAGIDTLMDLADLPGITRVTPISVRMVFEK